MAEEGMGIAGACVRAVRRMRADRARAEGPDVEGTSRPLARSSPSRRTRSCSGKLGEHVHSVEPNAPLYAVPPFEIRGVFFLCSFAMRLCGEERTTRPMPFRSLQSLG
jgi:hypothetical protein